MGFVLTWTTLICNRHFSTSTPDEHFKWYLLSWSVFQTHLSPKRSCRWVSRVSNINRNMVKCLTSKGQHTKVMQVYRHRAMRRLSKMFTGTPTAPPIAPTQPRHSLRQQETLPGWVHVPWVLPRASATRLLPLTTIHNLILTAITDIDSMHWNRENSHMFSMSARDESKKERMK